MGRSGHRLTLPGALAYVLLMFTSSDHPLPPGTVAALDRAYMPPAATFFCRADGDSMMPDIASGDLLVVDRSLQAQDNDIVVATLDGGLTVKRLRKTPDGWELASDNPVYPSFPIDPAEGVTVWGVVTYAVSALARR